ncbi:MAG: AAA family ATPase [Lachnospiraceae bacterium]|nr:AAA family ATPase [Lachnospiraceae bacterium]
MHKLIMLRGNSGSGKTTVAKELQKLFGRGTMVLSQDMIRREVLKERDGIDPPALPLIKQMLRSVALTSVNSDKPNLLRGIGSP